MCTFPTETLADLEKSLRKKRVHCPPLEVRDSDGPMSTTQDEEEVSNPIEVQRDAEVLTNVFYTLLEYTKYTKENSYRFAFLLDCPTGAISDEPWELERFVGGFLKAHDILFLPSQ